MNIFRLFSIMMLLGGSIVTSAMSMERETNWPTKRKEHSSEDKNTGYGKLEKRQRTGMGEEEEETQEPSTLRGNPELNDLINKLLERQQAEGGHLVLKDKRSFFCKIVYYFQRSLSRFKSFISFSSEPSVFARRYYGETKVMIKETLGTRAITFIPFRDKGFDHLLKFHEGKDAIICIKAPSSMEELKQFLPHHSEDQIRQMYIIVVPENIPSDKEVEVQWVPIASYTFSTAGKGDGELSNQ